MSSSTVDIPPSLLSSLRSFRLSKAAPPAVGQVSGIVIKVDKRELRMEIEDEWQGKDRDEVEEDLPDNSPRFLLLSYPLSHSSTDVSRLSYPLVLLYWAPQTSSTDLLTLYTSCLSNLSVQADVGKVVDWRDGVDWQGLEKKLGK